MCMVSNIGDNWKDQFPEKWPNPPPNFIPQQQLVHVDISQADFDALKKEVEERKKLLEAAKRFDEKTGQPECEMDDKVKLIKEIAKFLGVDLGDVFGKPKK